MSYRRRFTILGCSSSPGVPRITGDWGACDPKNSRNRRTRAAFLIEQIAPDGGMTTVLLVRHGLVGSMSRKGHCTDNAHMESFWATLKNELVHHEHYKTREQARQSIFEYIEIFYNRKRLHSSLGYLSPEMFEAGLN